MAKSATTMAGSETSMGKAKTARDESTYSGRTGAAICARRISLGLSIEDFRKKLLAKNCEVSTQTIYAWEAGTRPIPLNDIPAISAVLSLRPHDFLPKS